MLGLDSAVWGYARAADSLGVDIIQNCEVLASLEKMEILKVCKLEDNERK